MQEHGGCTVDSALQVGYLRHHLSGAANNKISRLLRVAISRTHYFGSSDAHIISTHHTCLNVNRLWSGCRLCSIMELPRASSMRAIPSTSLLILRWKKLKATARCGQSTAVGHSRVLLLFCVRRANRTSTKWK